MAKPSSNGDGSVQSPPRPLGKAGMGLWRSVLSEFTIDDSSGIEMLCQACGALDRVESLRAIVERDGEMIATRLDGPKYKIHPALREELANRSFVCKTLQRLGLDSEAVKPIGRPTRPRGWLGPHG